MFQKKNTHTRKQKSKETKEEKRISVGNLTGYDDIVCEFPMCTINLRHRVVSFYWLFISAIKKAVLKNFAIMTGSKYCEVFKDTYFEEHLLMMFL